MPRYRCSSRQRGAARRTVSRRDFLRLAGLITAGLLSPACQAPTPEAAPPTLPATAPATAPPTQPTAPAAAVAIGQTPAYEREAVRRQVAELIEQLGGLGDVVRPGDSVAIKTNLTGGVGNVVRGVEPVDSFVTHPEVVRALVEEVQAAGASEVHIVEAVYQWESYTQWGYADLAADLGVSLVDLNDFKPGPDFIEGLVGEGSLIYPSFIFNPILAQVDVFMSVSKMKHHYEAGVTHTMKNLFGLVPYRFYRQNQSDAYRSGFHGAPDETRSRIPRIIVDLNRARPIHFSLVDGIKTVEGGEGPWIETCRPIEPGVLIAGKNCVATDAVATAVMGHDPAADYPHSPFLRGENHLNLAAAAGLGPNRLDEIEVRGVPIETARVQFQPG